MRRFVSEPWLSALVPAAMVLIALSGCAENSMVMKGQVSQLQQQQLAVARQHQQLQDRASALDRDNQELGAMLAQSRQQSKVLEDQLGAMREQLRGVTAQLTDVRQEKQSADNKVQALTASMRRKGGVSITPNNSLLKTLPAQVVPDMHVRRDGDVIRVELPGSQLFESGSARLRSGAASLISSVAAEMYANYPDQIIGIEGHTDSDPIGGRQVGSNHELSVHRAMAVHDTLVGRTRYRPDQLFVVGHGPNHPVVSNATLEGKKRNRRVELVVYPERKG